MSVALLSPTKFLYCARDVWQLHTHSLSLSFPQGQVALFSTWRHSVQAKVVEIGKKEPQRASLISRTLIFYQGTARERDALRRLGLEVPSFLIREGLPGGMLGNVEGEVSGLIIGMVKGAVQLLVEGNKKEMKAGIDMRFIKARAQLPGGEWVEGYHEGGRTLSKPVRSIDSYWMKRYRLLACGAGKFISDRVKYEGDFFDDLFHDLTGNARYFIEQDTKYTGCFKSGKRSGYGSLEKYSQEERKFYLYYQGTWNDDQVESGVFFSPQGEEIVTVKEGVVQRRGGGAVFCRTFQDGGPASISPSLTRRRPCFLDPKIPPEKAYPCIAKKLLNPRVELSLDESVDLLTTCMHYGQEHSKKIEGKEAIIVVGNSGAGKSTLVNYLAGCTMELKSPKELGFTGFEEVVAVRPESAGGALDEVVPINYTRTLKTFMPQIKIAPDYLTYCDCPGFLGDCGEEINIANAVNIRRFITKARSIKVVIPINYHRLLENRGQSLAEMLQICSNLFGHVENLERYYASLLLGVTQVPLGVRLEEIKRWMIEDTPPIMHMLSQRLFIFDPLDRPLEGGWNRATCLSRLQALPPIENPAAIFKTVLTESDEKKLFGIGEQIGEEIKQALKGKEYTLAASKLRHLQSLSHIEYISLKRVFDQSLIHARHHFQYIVDVFRERCNFEQLSAANELLKELKGAAEIFGELFGKMIDPQLLSAIYQEAEVRCHERQEGENLQKERFGRAQSRIAELLQLLEEQKQKTLEQMQAQEERFREMRGEMKGRLQAIQSSYLQMEATLQKEREGQLAKREAALSLAQSFQQKESQLEIVRERQGLESAYRQKLEQAKVERKALLAEQTALNEHREKTIAAEREKLQGKLQAIEAERMQRIAELHSKPSSFLAFGGAEWGKYFGEVGEEPPLPPHVEEILKSPCPFWPEKRVEDTHMLVLIPQYVNGKLFHLNALSELVRNPRTGYKTQYDYYDDIVQSELGEKSFASHWVLMTQDVIPDSRNKVWGEQKTLVQKYAKQSTASYELPTALEAATAILTKHVKAGVRLYPHEPRSYTRCQEGVIQNRWPVAIGGFSPEGLLLYYDRYNDVDGVACLRRF